MNILEFKYLKKKSCKTTITHFYNMISSLRGRSVNFLLSILFHLLTIFPMQCNVVDQLKVVPKMANEFLSLLPQNKNSSQTIFFHSFLRLYCKIYIRYQFTNKTCVLSPLATGLYGFHMQGRIKNKYIQLVK